MKIASDWHIHSRNSYDGHMVLEGIIDKVLKRGIKSFGVADHLSTPMQEKDIANAHKEFALAAPSSRFLDFHFGVEVSTISKWEMELMRAGGIYDRNRGIREGGPYDDEPDIALTADMIDRYGIEYVIGGVHWPLYVPFERNAVIRSFHRQQMFLASHPLVTIVAHPWCFMGHWADVDGMMTADPWYDDFCGSIPGSMHDEFASSVVQNNKIVEINTNMILGGRYLERFKLDYLDWLAFLKSRSVRFSIGSDCHGPDYKVDMNLAEQMISSVGITDDDIWLCGR